jgi:hypothetical protein
METAHGPSQAQRRTVYKAAEALWPPLGSAQRHGRGGPGYTGQKPANGVKFGQTSAASRLNAAQNTGHALGAMAHAVGLTRV